MPLFLDACALAKRYLPEYGSKRMLNITDRIDHWGGGVVSGFVEPEVISVLAKYARVHPKRPPDAIQRHPATVDQLRAELARTAFTVVSVTDELMKQAADLLRNHPEYSIHAGDAVHLATALAVRALQTFKGALVFVTSDFGLEAAAQAEGLTTYNPARDGVGVLRAIPGLAPS